MNYKKWIDFLTGKKGLAIVFTIITIFVSAQQYFQGTYNNFIIFRASFGHLIHLQNLYLHYFKEYDDVFLYSPTFALLMAPFSIMPYWLCLLIWTAIPCMAMYYVIFNLPLMDQQKRITLFLILIVELVTSLQNMQTSPLLAAFTAVAFICFEKKKNFWVCFFIIFMTFTKIYGLAAAMLFIVYPDRLKFIFFMIFWGLVFAILPVVVIPFKQLLLQYHNWFDQITEVHHGEETGVNANLLRPPLSVMEWLKLWFHINPPALYIQLTGAIILVLPLIRNKLYKNLTFRYFLLSSVLIFCMIFNHIAESPSYVIAVFGIAIWFTWKKKNPFTILLLIIAMLFTVLVATDIFPEYVRYHYAVPYVWKAVPCILVWFWLQFRLLTMKENQNIVLNDSPV